MTSRAAQFNPEAWKAIRRYLRGEWIPLMEAARALKISHQAISQLVKRHGMATHTVPNASGVRFYRLLKKADLARYVQDHAPDYLPAMAEVMAWKYPKERWEKNGERMKTPLDERMEQRGWIRVNRATAISGLPVVTIQKAVQNKKVASRRIPYPNNPQRFNVFVHREELETYARTVKRRPLKERPSRRRPFVSYLDASTWAQQQGIHTSDEWRVRRKAMGNQWPVGIPVNPRTVYGKDWKGWGEFLNTHLRAGVQWSRISCNQGEVTTVIERA